MTHEDKQPDSQTAAGGPKGTPRRGFSGLLDGRRPQTLSPQLRHQFQVFTMTVPSPPGGLSPRPLQPCPQGRLLSPLPQKETCHGTLSLRSQWISVG